MRDPGRVGCATNRVAAVMPRLAANARAVSPLLSCSAINARHFASVFVMPPDRGNNQWRSQMGLPGAYRAVTGFGTTFEQVARTVLRAPHQRIGVVMAAGGWERFFLRAD